MSVVKSFSVGVGDMFYIKHNSDNFTVIDCCYSDEDNQAAVYNEIEQEQKGKGITRFISTHPDDDHIKGIKDYCDRFGIVNFYCVENKANKDTINDRQKEDFDTYCDLRDGSRHYYLEKGCRRKWMNISDNERGCAGINCLWPLTSNADYKDALKKAANKENPNNISPVITYSIENGATFIWLGDMETDFLEKVKDNISFEKVDVLFAPHHGRKSGHIPTNVLEKLQPKLIIVGEAPSKDLDYYKGYHTITQNTAGDIAFICEGDEIRIYVSEKSYSTTGLFQDSQVAKIDSLHGYYIGTLDAHSSGRNRFTISAESLFSQQYV